MPRRRAGKASTNGRSKPRPVDRASASIKKWNTIEDIPLDEEEQFHTNRDKILLEGNDDDSEFDGVEDEIFALKGMPDDDEDDEEEEEISNASDGDEEAGEDLVPTSASPRKTQKASSAKKKAPVPSSSSDSEEEEEENWGHKKSAYYSSNANDIDSEDEEANELEEQEAIRLQAKSREAINEDAFGFPNQLEDIAVPDDHNLFAPDQDVVVDELPQDKEAILRHLAKTTPETLALARDWEDTAIRLMKVKQSIEDTQANEPESPQLGRLHFYYQGLLTYATTLAFYLHLRASSKYSQRPHLLRTHPILGRLLSLKQSLSTLEELGFDEDEDEDDDSDDDLMFDEASLLRLSRKEGLDKDELRDLLLDAMNGEDPDGMDRLLNGVSDDQEDEGTDEDEELVLTPPPAKKQKTSASTKKTTKSKSPSSKPVFDLVEPEFVSSQATSSSSVNDPADAYGEHTSLHSHDAADKSARRKSLRFHTSKIENASNRRQSARSSAMGGDDDIPYRDRKKEQAARKNLGQGGADLDGNDSHAVIAAGEKRSRVDEDDSDGEGADGYYDLVKKRKQEKKKLQQAEYKAAKVAARPDLHEEAADGPRSLTRSILKNKGLTPHRAKDVRNPRVKKRHKYEKAKKKVASQKAVYKGGISQTGRYDGERTGITRVHKGISLG
jgi:U3 small nucleolar RNA-associated protein 3